MTKTPVRFKVDVKGPIAGITSRWGNFLPLTDASGRLVEDAPHIVLGFMYFPDDVVTAWAYVQAVSLMQDDPILGDFSGDDPKVAKWIAQSVTGTLQQRQNAQLIGNAFFAGAAAGRQISLRQAVFMAQHELENGATWQKKRHPQDEKNLREAFHRFSPSIHLLLAATTLSKEEFSSLQSRPDVFRRFLSAAAHFQAVLAAKAMIEAWRPWGVHPGFIGPNDSLTAECSPDELDKVLSLYKADRDRKGKAR